MSGIQLNTANEALGKDVHKSPTYPVQSDWKPWQLVLFRIAFVFFILMSVPNSIEWYKNAFSIDWTNLHYRDPYDIARFGSGLDWFGNKIFGSTLEGYAIWVITLLFSTGVGLIWTAAEKLTKKETSNYDRLNYWLRVIVRYRAGIGIIGFGFTKLLPTQMPYPSLGLLNTDFGDFTLQKIYWLSIGIVPWYQVFAGVVEIVAGLLLFFRKTTTLGSILLFGALGDIVYVNFAYDGGVHVYSSYFVLLAAFLLVQDTPRIFNLLVREKFTLPARYYYPALTQTWQKITRYGVKSTIIGVFLILFFYLSLTNLLFDPYKQPAVKGATELRGNYNVTEFRINNETIPYSPEDTIRWSRATFENWSSLTFKVNKPTPLDLSNGGGSPMRDIDRTFELTGTGGGQRVFYYQADTVNQVLYLQDKFKARNPGDRGKEQSVEDTHPVDWIPEKSLANIGDETYKIDPRASSTRRIREYANAPKTEKRNRMILQYQSINNGDKVILTGIDENKNSLYIVLDRFKKDYTLSQSTIKAGKYD